MFAETTSEGESNVWHLKSALWCTDIRLHFQTCSLGLVIGTSTKDSLQTTCGICDSFHRWGRRIEWVITSRNDVPLNSCPLKAERKVTITSGFEQKESIFFLTKHGFWISALKWNYFCDNVPESRKVKQVFSCFRKWNNFKPNMSLHWLHQWWVTSWMTFMAYLNDCGPHLLDILAHLWTSKCIIF